jgi:hypothetical protein
LACTTGSERARTKAGDDIFYLMFCSTACSDAMFWAICSCLAASCSTLFHIKARSRAVSSNCCTNSGEIEAAAVAGCCAASCADT